MDKQQWLEEFDKRLPKFEWFLQEYCFEMLEFLNILRKKKNAEMMFTVMNDIWFHLPDNKFNIIVNPKGWGDFLFLLENPFVK